MAKNQKIKTKMMKKEGLGVRGGALLRRVVLSGFLASGVSGCVYTKITVPLDEDVNDTQLGSKVGTASNQSIMWAVAWGDAGTKAAADNGDIKTIRHMDQEQLVILFGIYSRMKTIVYGD